MVFTLHNFATIRSFPAKIHIIVLLYLYIYNIYVCLCVYVCVYHHTLPEVTVISSSYENEFVFLYLIRKPDISSSNNDSDLIEISHGVHIAQFCNLSTSEKYNA